MSETVKHTPRNLFSDVDGFGNNRVGAFGFDTFDGTEIIAQVRTPVGVTFDQAKAFARLFSSAPDLLDALTSLLEVHDAMGAGKSHAATKARAAITKAGG